ncbi:MAG: oxidoreductase, partial [Hyphomicrobiaceae bacterium]
MRELREKIGEADVLKEAEKLIEASSRRRFLRGGLSLGTLALVTGAAYTGGGNAIEAALRRVSEWNDGAQAMLFSPARMARTFPERAIRRPFPFNAHYEEEKAPEIEAADYELEVT